MSLTQKSQKQQEVLTSGQITVPHPAFPLTSLHFSLNLVPKDSCPMGPQKASFSYTPSSLSPAPSAPTRPPTNVDLVASSV